MSKSPWRRRARSVAPPERTSGYEAEFSFDDSPLGQTGVTPNSSFGADPWSAPDQSSDVGEPSSLTLGFSDEGTHSPGGFDYSLSDDFGDDLQLAAGVGPTAVRSSSSPLWILAATAAAGAMALLLAALLGNRVPVAFVAWSIAGPVAILLYGAFLFRDGIARGVVGYTYPPWLATARYAALVIVGLGVLVASWRIGEWAGQL